jgi:hypothetical protein
MRLHVSARKFLVAVIISISLTAVVALFLGLNPLSAIPLLATFGLFCGIMTAILSMLN